MSAGSSASGSKGKLIKNERVTKFQYLRIGDSRVGHVSVHPSSAVPGRALLRTQYHRMKMSLFEETHKLNLLRLHCPRRQFRNNPTLRCRASRCSCILVTLRKHRKLVESRRPRVATWERCHRPPLPLPRDPEAIPLELLPLQASDNPEKFNRSWVAQQRNCRALHSTNNKENDGYLV